MSGCEPPFTGEVSYPSLLFKVNLCADTASAFIELIPLGGDPAADFLPARLHATRGASMFDLYTLRALGLVAAMLVVFCGAVELLHQLASYEVLQQN